MNQRALRACALAGLVVILAGCSRQPQQAIPPTPLSEVDRAVSRLSAEATVTALDVRTLPGRSPRAFLEVRTETTPTAGQVFSVLEALSHQYGPQGRVINLAVITPGSGPGNLVRLELRYNPTASTIATEGTARALPPGMVLLSVGRGGGDVFASTPGNYDIILAPRSTVGDISAAAGGSGDIVTRLRARVPLP